jgi:endonuclease/exonuclease/phosphatase family metal-dependent hydrolase
MVTRTPPTQGRARTAVALAVTLAGCGGGAPASEMSDGPPDASISTSASLHVLTYNVAGLPDEIVPGASRSNSLIGPLLGGYDLVLLQEDFAYHTALLDRAGYAHATPLDPSARALGDGLTVLTAAPFTDFLRVAWSDCFGLMDSGSDCLTPKGFTLLRLSIAGLGSIDVYNVHTDAGAGPDDRAARQKNLSQLAQAIRAQSADRPLIVAGDFNTRYAQVDDGLQAFWASITGLRDAWIDVVRSGQIPSAAQPASCATSDPDDPACERIDKIYYRSGRGLTLAPTDYRVEGARFVDERGMQLSDHRPVSTRFTVTMR